jgi:hypothetical protein
LSRTAVIATRKSSKEAEKQQDPRFYPLQIQSRKVTCEKTQQSSGGNDDENDAGTGTHNNSIIAQARGYGGRNGPFFYSNPILLSSFFSQSPKKNQ